MAIRNLDTAGFDSALAQFVRPSTPIDSFELLVDRSAQLNRIEEAIAATGQHVFIYGESGAGKTSLASTAAYQHQSSFDDPVFCACGSKTSFASIVRDVIEQLLNRSRTTQTELTREAGFSGVFAGKIAQKQTARTIPDVIDLNLAVTLMKEAVSQRPGRSVVVIDDFERLPSIEDRQQFGELAKQLSDRKVPIALLFCGVGQTINELLESHVSHHRYFEGVQMPTPPLSFDARTELVRQIAGAFGLDVDEDVCLRIGRVSDGFPHYIHLLCQKMVWAAHRAPEVVHTLDNGLYRQAVAAAIESVEAHLRLTYDKAVKKDRDDYREVLWAVADHYETERNMRRIYDESYLRIMEVLGRIPLELEQFQGCLARLRTEPHGEILISKRRSWTGFRQGIMRGYVRLMAESSGVAIAF